jgi:predicted nucleotidyltransferase
MPGSGGNVVNDTVHTILTELRLEFKKLYGDRLVQLLLYGSQARGDARPGSDIDCLVVLKGPIDPGAEITRVVPYTASLSLQHDVVISCAFISEERFDNEQSPFLINVRREGLPA